MKTQEGSRPLYEKLAERTATFFLLSLPWLKLEIKDDFHVVSQFQCLLEQPVVCLNPKMFKIVWLNHIMFRIVVWLNHIMFRIVVWLNPIIFSTVVEPQLMFWIVIWLKHIIFRGL